LSMPDFRVAILMACHNRHDKTVACLAALRAQQGRVECPETTGKDEPEPPASAARPSTLRSSSPSTLHDYAIELFLTDDGSTDGTADAVKAIWPGATIIPGNGELYWCGGMRTAWTEAAKHNPDFYLLLNDDTLLYPNAVRELFSLASSPIARCIAVGAICDPQTLHWTYGGSDCGRPFDPTEQTGRVCRSLNANCALVPRAVFEEIGMFDSVYTHSMGDHDYGTVATRAGIPIRETPRFVGTCEKNPHNGTWRDPSLSRRLRWQKLLSPKGLPPKEWLHYCRKQGRWFWPAIFLSPYLKVLLGSRIQQFVLNFRRFSRHLL